MAVQVGQMAQCCSKFPAFVDPKMGENKKKGSRKRGRRKQHKK